MCQHHPITGSSVSQVTSTEMDRSVSFPDSGLFSCSSAGFSPSSSGMDASGTFSGSAFVQETTGVDCVSERAAVKASGGTMVIKKIAEDGMTFALAESEEGISFE